MIPIPLAVEFLLAGDVNPEGAIIIEGPWWAVTYRGRRRCRYHGPYATPDAPKIDRLLKEKGLFWKDAAAIMSCHPSSLGMICAGSRWSNAFLLTRLAREVLGVELKDVVDAAPYDEKYGPTPFWDKQPAYKPSRKNPSEDPVLLIDDLGERGCLVRPLRGVPLEEILVNGSNGGSTRLTAGKRKAA